MPDCLYAPECTDPGAVCVVRVYDDERVTEHRCHFHAAHLIDVESHGDDYQITITLERKQP